MHFIYYILQSGRTPLHEASERTDEKVVDALIKAGANINIVSYFQVVYLYIYVCVCVYIYIYIYIYICSYA